MLTHGLCSYDIAAMKKLNPNLPYSFGIVVIVLVCQYFLLYKPYEDRLAYQRNIDCSTQAAQWSVAQKKRFDQLVSGADSVWYSDPSSHFNKKLGSCLAEIETIATYGPTGNPITTNMYTDKRIVDAIGNNVIVYSTINDTISKGTTTEEIVGGVSSNEFSAQEAILMEQ